ncbi:MAG: hypothetical protein HC851_12040 [Acaryochloris sp. RU_4_1]|nr:hypothetical protein [Acaryochloris sp. RU_4_1]NJR54965.1 hypothetical protein [Acaryochloris sp. CRU_2_0]
MHKIRAYLSQTILLKGLVIAFTCSLFFISNALPAAAISGSSTSDLSEGIPNLENIQKNTEEYMYGYNKMPGLKETQERSAQGPNEVQGGADLDKMYTPENSQGATTTLDTMKQGVDKLLGKD